MGYVPAFLAATNRTTLRSLQRFKRRLTVMEVIPMSPATINTATSRNPATGATLATYPFHTRDEVERLLDANTAAFQLWRATPMQERVATYRRLADRKSVV